MITIAMASQLDRPELIYYKNDRGYTLTPWDTLYNIWPLYIFSLVESYIITDTA